MARIQVQCNGFDACMAHSIFANKRLGRLMDTEFWHERWATNNIAFHAKEANPLLVTHFSSLSLEKGARVFLPLCGKTLDIAWLLSQGYRVVGVELVETAIEQLFMELGVEPEVATVGELKHYSAENIDIFVGDFFALSAARLGTIDAIYDRAALVALPEDMRQRYTAHLTTITGNAPQLLIVFEYDQSQLAGPPFSIVAEEVDNHYAGNYQLTQVEVLNVKGGLKGKCPATEHAWLLINS